MAGVATWVEDSTGTITSQALQALRLLLEVSTLLLPLPRWFRLRSMPIGMCAGTFTGVFFLQFMTQSHCRAQVADDCKAIDVCKCRAPVSGCRLRGNAGVGSQEVHYVLLEVVV